MIHRGNCLSAAFYGSIVNVSYLRPTAGSAGRLKFLLGCVMSEMTADMLSDTRELFRKYMALVISEESVSYLEIIPFTNAVKFTESEIALLTEFEGDAKKMLGMSD